MRIHTKIVIDIATMKVIEDNSYNYEGTIALCGGGGGGGGGSQSSIVQTNLMPVWAQPYVENYLAAINTLSLTAYNVYTGITYAAQNIDETDGITALATRGRNPHAIITKGETYLKNTLDALKFNINPKINAAYLKMAETIIKNFEEDTLPRLKQSFNLSGNYGDDSHHWAQAKAAEDMMAKLQDIGMDVYFKDYLMERGAQVATLDNAIPYGTQDVLNAETLRHAGLLSREYRYGSFEDTYRKWYDMQTGTIKKLSLLENGLKTVIGSNIVETSPYYLPSTMQYVAGFALAGMGAYGQISSMRTPPGAGSTGTNTGTNMGTSSGYTNPQSIKNAELGLASQG